MNLPVIDKSILYLLTIQISGAGIFAVLLKFNVPQLNASYWGENPYASKRDIIENILIWIFTIFAIFRLLMQAFSKCYGSILSERIHT